MYIKSLKNSAHEKSWVDTFFSSPRVQVWLEVTIFFYSLSCLQPLAVSTVVWFLPMSQPWSRTSRRHTARSSINVHFVPWPSSRRQQLTRMGTHSIPDWRRENQSECWSRLRRVKSAIKSTRRTVASNSRWRIGLNDCNPIPTTKSQENRPFCFTTRILDTVD